jgi:hypothetical protein
MKETEGSMITDWLEQNPNSYIDAIVNQHAFIIYLEALKARRTEDNYNYSDEDFEKHIEYIRTCFKNDLSVYKCLEFMYYDTNEAKSGVEYPFRIKRKDDNTEFFHLGNGRYRTRWGCENGSMSSHDFGSFNEDNFQFCYLINTNDSRTKR